MAKHGEHTTSDIGAQAELAAQRHLEGHGYGLVEANFRCRLGEIDLIMQKADVLVFVEVKFRRSNRFGHAEEMVTASKQRKLIATAEHFLNNHTQYSHCACRFDVVAIEYDNSRKLIVNWIDNAFSAY